MSDKLDTKKIQAFVEAALTNPLHPLYRVGYAQSPILQHYATNVKLLPALSPEQWFAQYPVWAGKLAEAMALCESMAAEDARVAEAARPDVAALRADLAATNAKLAEALAAIAALAAKPEPDESGDEDTDETK